MPFFLEGIVGILAILLLLSSQLPHIEVAELAIDLVWAIYPPISVPPHYSFPSTTF